MELYEYEIVRSLDVLVGLVVKLQKLALPHGKLQILKPNGNYTDVIRI